MASLKVTTKRQVTLPVALCDELGVAPGDRIEAERRVVDGETVWVLGDSKPDWSWFGAAKKYGRGKSHRWGDVRRSIERGGATAIATAARPGSRRSAGARDDLTRAPAGRSTKCDY
jgi:bifunctional DNA-binding transcriptional regulator/antitoxin component of YhaV-PrlF toxin-antitoxin module